jgi:hypothetical protein
MNGEYQFSLRHIFIVTTLLAVCLGTGKWCYLMYDDRIRPVTRNSELQHSIGKRVSLCGRYQHIGGNSSFQVMWFGEPQYPIAITNICADGSLLPEIPDGAPIAVTGRLTVDLQNGATFPLPVMRRDWHSGLLIYDGRNIQGSSSTPYRIMAEEVGIESESESENGIDNPRKTYY